MVYTLDMLIVYQTQNVNTPSIISTATALAANAKRISWTIVNLGTNPLYVCKGTGASATVFHVPLKGSTVQDDGTGGSVSEENGVIYTGIITVGGTSPRYVVTEHAPG